MKSAWDSGPNGPVCGPGDRPCRRTLVAGLVDARQYLTKDPPSSRLPTTSQVAQFQIGCRCARCRAELRDRGFLTDRVQFLVQRHPRHRIRLRARHRRQVGEVHEAYTPYEGRVASHDEPRQRRDGDGHPQGRPPPDHVPALWTDPSPRGTARSTPGRIVFPPRDRAAHGFPPQRRSGTRSSGGVPTPVRPVDRRQGAQRGYLPRRRGRGPRRSVAAGADGTGRPPRRSRGSAYRRPDSMW